MNETQAADDPPAIRKSIDVRRPLDETFRLFTESMDRWWPLASHSVGLQNAAMLSAIFLSRVSDPGRPHWLT